MGSHSITRWSDHIERARKAYANKNMKQAVAELNLAEQAAMAEPDSSKKEAQKVITAFRNFLGPIHQADAQGQLETPLPSAAPSEPAHRELEEWHANLEAAIQVGDDYGKVHWGAMLLNALNSNDYPVDSFTYYDYLLEIVACANFSLGAWPSSAKCLTMRVRRQVAGNEPYSEQINSRVPLANCLGNSGHWYLAIKLLEEVEQRIRQYPGHAEMHKWIGLLERVKNERLTDFRNGVQGAKIAATQIIGQGNACADAGNFIQAANNFDRAVWVYNMCFGKSSETTISAKSMVAEALLKAGKTAEANAYPELVIAEAARLLQKSFWTTDIEVYQLLNDTIRPGLTYAQATKEQQAKMEQAWNEFCVVPEKYPNAHRLCKSAERMSREAITKLESSGFPVRDLLSQAYLSLGKALNAMGESVEAIKHLDKAEEYRKLDYGFIFDDVEVDDLPFDASELTFIPAAA